MLTRRILRIKAYQVLYASRARNEVEAKAVITDFNRNIEEFEQMYFFLLKFPSYFDSYLDSEKQIELEKYFPNKEKLREASVLNNTAFIEEVDKSEILHSKTSKSTFRWNNFGELFNKVFKSIKQEPFFIDYLVFEERSISQQKEFLIQLFGYLFESNEDFIQEMKGVYLDWDNDVFVHYRLLKKSIEDTSAEKGLVLSDIFVNREDDYSFAKQLLQITMKDRDVYDQMMHDYSQNWDPERISKTDIILMQMAITEFLHFPLIPLKVTINEYLDIAKEFSTPKSHTFINGILDKIKVQLSASGKIVKEGRGLKDH